MGFGHKSNVNVFQLTLVVHGILLLEFGLLFLKYRLFFLLLDKRSRQTFFLT